MTTVIVTPDLVGPIQNGGIGTFSYHFARLLREHGERVTILFTSPPEKPRRKWIQRYTELQIPVIEVPEPTAFRHAYGDWWFIRRSEAVTANLPADTEVVYLQDWQANGLHLARSRRFQNRPSPLLVTVLHSPTRWAQMGMSQFPWNIDEALTVDFAERYTVQHSDAVVSPSIYMLEWAQEWGWKLPQRQYVAGLPFFPRKVSASRTPTSRIRRLIFFGRLETRKGFEVFVDGLVALHEDAPELLQSISEIVFLGKEGIHAYNTPEKAATYLRRQTRIPVRTLTDFDTGNAQAYLQRHAQDSLVVIASQVDNYPYAVIEVSSIPGLRVLAAATGGIPEIIREPLHLFVPNRRGFITALRHWLAECPPSVVTPYDWASHNQQWLDLHRQFQVLAREPAVAVDSRRPTVDVCVTHYNLGRFLPQTLHALSQQTFADMGVIVVDDASTDRESQYAFEKARKQYEGHGWRFIARQVNQGVGEARNLAASQSNAEYLIFVDADNVPIPTMVECFVEAILNSQDDCLTCYTKAFRGESYPIRAGAGGTIRELVPVLYQYMPVGNDLAYGLLSNVFGDVNFIIRREAFESVGGFQARNEFERHAGYEDYELLVRLSIDGYRLDIVPEYLLYYRHREDSLLRTTDSYQNMLRIQRVYRDYLQSLGLGHLAPTVWELYRLHQQYTGTMAHLEPRWIAENIPWYTLLAGLREKIRKHLRTVPVLKRFA